MRCGILAPSGTALAVAQAVEAMGWQAVSLPTDAALPDLADRALGALVVARFLPQPPAWGDWARAVRALRPDLPVVGLAGRDDEEGRAMAAAFRAAGYPILVGDRVPVARLQQALRTAADGPGTGTPPAGERGRRAPAAPAPGPATAMPPGAAAQAAVAREAPPGAAAQEPAAVAEGAGLPPDAAASAGGGADVGLPEAPAPLAPMGGPAPVVVVASGKAGVGKTTVVANLLAALHTLGIAQVAGVDLDAAKPDLWFQFRDPEQPAPDLRQLLATLAGVTEERETLDRADAGLVADWIGNLAPVAPGILAVPGPVRDLAPVTIPPAVALEIVRQAQARAQLVLVDTAWDVADAATLAVLHAATRILVVTTPDPAAEYQTAWFLQQLEWLHVEAPQQLVVVRRAQKAAGRSPAELAESLRRPLLGEVGFDPALARAWGQRRPPAWGQRRGIWPALARRLATPPARRRWWRR